MIHKKMLAFLGVLVCMYVGVLSAEPPISPWQALNPASPESIQYEVLSPEEEYDDSQYETTYPEGHHLNETDYLSDEEIIVEHLPFKLPFKMDKKQLAVAIKLLKEAVKPVLKSKRVRSAVAYIDESLSSYKADLETQMYVTLLLDSIQEIYEGKETSELNMMLKRFFTDMSDEETARTIGNVWTSYLSPIMTSLIYNPMRNYVVEPITSYIYDPLSNYVNDFAERIGTWMEGSSRPYIDIQYPETYSRWSETVNAYTNRISDWTAQARQGLEMASRMLELQEEARCTDCGHPDHDAIYSASVQ